MSFKAHASVVVFMNINDDARNSVSARNRRSSGRNPFIEMLLKLYTLR